MDAASNSLSMDSHLKLHYEAEEQSLQLLLQLENEYREHYALSLREIQLQKELTERLWLLSQRYIILVSTGPCCKYPDIYSGPAEDVIIAEYFDKLKQLHSSNCRIMNSLHSLRVSCRKFEKLCSQLDKNVQSPLMLGDTFHKPLSFFIELVSDLFKSFHANTLKMKYCAHQMDPGDCTGLEEYKKLLIHSEEFEEYLKMGLTYCKCLRPRKVCGDVRVYERDHRVCRDSEAKLPSKLKMEQDKQ